MVTGQEEEEGKKGGGTRIKCCIGAGRETVQQLRLNFKNSKQARMIDG